jgi:hypothetical protein
MRRKYIMRGFPRHINSKQDIDQLIRDCPGLKPKVHEYLTRILEEPDMVTQATTPIDPEHPENGYNTILIPNPNPLWKQLGYQDKAEVTAALSTTSE